MIWQQAEPILALFLHQGQTERKEILITQQRLKRKKQIEKRERKNHHILPV